MIINNKNLGDSKLKALIGDIKKKRSIAFIDKGFVEKEVIRYLKQNSRALEKIIESKKHSELQRSSEYKKTIKAVRKVLNRAVGAYQIDGQERYNLLKELEYCLKRKLSAECLEVHKKILSMNVSTKERLPFYDRLYKEIFSITGIPASILDLGAGLNPLSYLWMNLDNLEYYVYELNRNDCDFLQKYFALMKKYTKLKGHAKLSDISSEMEFPITDVCFLFKVLESLELTKKHKTSEELLKKIKSRFVIASFATKTLAKRKMTFARRGWFEMMLKRLGYHFRKIIKENETFYVAGNKSH